MKLKSSDFVRITIKQKECDISIDVLFLADENEYSFLCVSPFSGVYVRIHGSDEPLNFTVAELYEPYGLEKYISLNDFLTDKLVFLTDFAKEVAEETPRKLDRPFVDYYEYMDSIEWAELRQERIEYDDCQCRMCGKVAESFGDLQVHHITYERLGCHEIDDLITLCRPCHTKIHSIELARKQE